MALRPDILLSARFANPARSMMAGAQAAGTMDETRKGIQMNRMMQEMGPGIMAGDPQALNALSRFDPGAALTIKRQHAAERRAQAAAGRAAAAARESKAKAAELEKDYNLLRQVAMAGGDDPEALARAINTSGLGADGVTPDNFGFYLATAEGAKGLYDAWKETQPEPVEPDYQRVGNQVVDMNNPMGGAQTIPGITPEPTQRKIVKAADGYNYYQDTGERVFPNVVAAEQTPLVQNIFGGGESGLPTPPADASLTPAGVKGAFGLTDTGLNIASDVSDSIGFGTIRPEVQSAQTSIGETNTSAMLTLVAGYAGRPSNLTREQVNNILPKPGVMGNDKALSKAKNTRSLIANQIGEATQALNSGLLTDAHRSEAVQFIIATRRLYEAYDEIVKALESDGSTGGTAGGVQWRIVE